MVKKTRRPWSATVLGVLLTVNAYAFTKEGLYVGGGIGASIDDLELTSQNMLTRQIVLNERNEVSYIGAFFTGLGHSFTNGFFLGGEVGTYFDKRAERIYRNENPLAAFTNVLSVQDYATFDVLPGYRCAGGMVVYGRLGLSYANLELYQYPTTSMNSFKTDNQKLGGRLGLGVSFTLDQHLGLGLDYFYTSYSEMKATANETQFSSKVNSNYLGISAIYTI